MNNLVKNTILGTDITSGTGDQVLKYVIDLIEKKEEKCFITTPNPEIVMYAKSHPSFQGILNTADLALCDGVGLLIAGYILNKPFKDRITGVDFMEKLCKRLARKPVSIGLLGARPRVAEKVAKCLREKYPEIKIVFTASEWDEKQFPKRGVDLLFVAFGFPKQEEWIAQNLPKLPITVAMGVGGAFDYLSGEVARAPFLMRSVGLEWLFRLSKQPWRLKRQLALPHFVWTVLLERLKSY